VKKSRADHTGKILAIIWCRICRRSVCCPSEQKIYIFKIKFYLSYLFGCEILSDIDGRTQAEVVPE
jgi:hypothetical protein